MQGYRCKEATFAEVCDLWTKKENENPDDKSIKVWKEKALAGAERGARIYYYGYFDNEVICEAAALLDVKEVQNGEGLTGGDTVYLSGFKTKAGYMGKGYFSQLYKFVESDLEKRGYKKLTLGVEPCEVKNMMIYFKWGYTEFIKSAYEEYPSEDGGESEKILVNYYAKNL